MASDAVKPEINGAGKGKDDAEQRRPAAKAKSRTKNAEGTQQGVKRRCVSTACIACRKRKSKVSCRMAGFRALSLVGTYLLIASGHFSVRWKHAELRCLLISLPYAL
jgi:hypothetical protein